MTKKYYVLLLLFAVFAAVVARGQSELLSEKVNEDFFATIQPELLKQAADPATSPFDFMLLCKRLGVYGDKNAAAVVAQSLGDHLRSHSARTALQAMPFPEALQELRTAVGTVKDSVLKAGIIESLGMCQDRESVALLTPLLKESDVTIAIAATFALARIGDPAYLKEMLAQMDNTDPLLAKTYADLNLMYGEFLRTTGGHQDQAEKVFLTVGGMASSDFLQEAAYYQILLRDSDQTRQWAAQWLVGDNSLQYLAALRAAQFIKNDAMANALVTAYPQVSEEKKLAILAGIGDQRNLLGQPVLLAALNADNAMIKEAAINAMKAFADQAYFKDLVQAAIVGDEAFRKSSITVIEMLDDEVNGDILKLLAGSDAEKAFGAELVGARKIIEGTEDVFALAKTGTDSVRLAATQALGDIAKEEQLTYLIDLIVKPESSALTEAAKVALKNACGIYNDRANAAMKIAIAADLLKGRKEDRLFLFQMLSTLGGTVAREAIEKAACSDDRESADLATQVLGRWMDSDVAPVLLKLANTPGYPYASRALSGYLRLVRQFSMPEWRRRAMVRDAMASPVCGSKEKETVDIIVKQYQLDLNIAQTADQTALRNIEIQHAVYGQLETPAKTKDVTDKMREIVFKSDSLNVNVEGGYNKAFGGDPAPGIPKKLQLTLKYRDSGDTKEVTFGENVAIKLPAK